MAFSRFEMDFGGFSISVWVGPEFEMLGLKNLLLLLHDWDIENPRIEKVNYWFTLADPSFGAGVNRELENILPKFIILSSLGLV